MIHPLNWQEIALLIKTIGPQAEGLFVDRIIVPERPRFPDGYLKGEWMIRLTGRKQDSLLWFSIFPRRAYLAWSAEKGPKASTSATRSPFDLHLAKQLKGTKLFSLEAIPRERTVILWFSQSPELDAKLGLVLSLIPTAPEALLVQAPAQSVSTPEARWPILARSRTIRDPAQQVEFYSPPNGARAPAHTAIRTEWFSEPHALYLALEAELDTEAFAQRLKNTEKLIREALKVAQERLRQNQVTLKEAQQEVDWQHQGDLLKSSLDQPAPLQNGFRTVFDYTVDQEVQVRCDPQLTLQEQVEKCYQNSRRKQRRLSEAQTRIEQFEERIRFFSQLLTNLPHPPDWRTLEQIEKKLGVSSAPTAHTPTGRAQKKGPLWLGKSFVSQDGIPVLIGRNKTENLELTFKQARGNDLWLHVRGRPGAHAVIPVQPGKSIPLDTLLDAAQLVIYYSSGEKWGKTEVDYTFKKHVKRIKDSSEASYTHNKTLIVEPDPGRLKRLLGQSVGSSV